MFSKMLEYINAKLSTRLLKRFRLFLDFFWKSYFYVKQYATLYGLKMKSNLELDHLVFPPVTICRNNFLLLLASKREHRWANIIEIWFVVVQKVVLL